MPLKSMLKLRKSSKGLWKESPMSPLAELQLHEVQRINAEHNVGKFKHNVRSQ